ncbi:MAG: hypothetical protein KY452_01480 [Actinobacteria bacterium]|nr:hypothetical protein [Actinomycetota bacterium]
MTDTPPGGPQESSPVEGQSPSPYVRWETGGSGRGVGASRSRLVGMGVGLVALVGAGVFSVTMLSAASGSATAEAAVERLFGAVGEEDVIGVLEALAPGERSALRPVEDLADELRRLGIVSDDFDLGAVGGVDLQFDDLTFETEELGPGVAAVHITGGTVTSSTDPQQLPIGPTLRKLLGHFDAEPDFEATTTTEDLAADAPMIVALDEGDGWHASWSYTVAEGMRREAGEPVPAFGDGVEAAGADSPEAAVRQAVEAAVDLDARRLIGLVSPSEAAALHDYAPLFLDDAEAAVAELRAEVPYEVDVTHLDLSSETDGDVAQVRLGGFEASGTVPGLGRFSVSYDGDCFTFEADVEADTICAGDLPQSGFGGADTQMVVTTVRDDGQWYLSPTRTLFQQVLGALRALDRDDLEDPESLFGPFFGPGLGSAFAEGGDFVEGPGNGTSLFEGTPAPDAAVPGDAELLGEECFGVFEDLPPTAGPEDYERAEKEVDDCLDDLWDD